LFIKVKVIRDSHCEVNVNFSSWSTKLLKVILCMFLGTLIYTNQIIESDIVHVFGHINQY